MFFTGSRYAATQQYSFTLPDGTTVRAVRLPQPPVPAVLGYYKRQSGDRLDQIAGRFLGDATQFWRICNADGAVVPDALAARHLVGVPIDAPRGS